jgi:hypothetical protein
MPNENENPQQNDQNEPEEDEDDEIQEPGQPPRTEFANTVEALEAAMENLKRMPNLNPQTLRMHLLNDLYPILVDFANSSNWYVGDLHQRVTEVEEEVGGESGEGLTPEFAAQLIEFIGVSLQLFGVLVNICKNDPEVIGKVQLLIAQAPGIISKIQDITLVEEEEDEEEDEEDEEAEVLEPRSSQPEPVVQSPVAESVPTRTAAPNPDAVVNTTTSDSSPDAPIISTTTPIADAPVVGGSTTTGVTNG